MASTVLALVVATAMAMTTAVEDVGEVAVVEAGRSVGKGDEGDTVESGGGLLERGAGPALPHYLSAAQTHRAAS